MCKQHGTYGKFLNLKLVQVFFEHSLSKIDDPGHLDVGVIHYNIFASLFEKNARCTDLLYRFGSALCYYL